MANSSPASGDSAADPLTLAGLGEEELIARLVTPLSFDDSVLVGPGDDCAVIKTGGETWQLLKTDCLIEGVHFVPETDPELVGRKAMNRVLSDIAAMGGKPLHALVTVAMDRERPVAEVEGWYQGLSAAADEFRCQIVGGETSTLPRTGAILSVAMTGQVDPSRCVLRSGAQEGDVIAVTGKLGGSFASGRHLSFCPRIRESAWLCEYFLPSAMMDLSDGLGSDLGKLVAASGVGYSINREEIPCHAGVDAEHAIIDGEDYELLLTMPPAQFEKAVPAFNREFPQVEIHAIGVVTSDTTDPLSGGWEHYRSS